MAMNYIRATDINNGLSSGTQDYVSACERIYNYRLAEAAEKIYMDAKTRPLVLLSGPSGSGKTTSALRIGKHLREKGLSVHIISMDNYFLPDGVGEMPLDDEGKIDLESPLRMDIPLFSEHLKKMFKGEPVELPKFEKTVSGCREKGGGNAKEGEEVHHVSDLPQEAKERSKALEGEVVGQLGYSDE